MSLWTDLDPVGRSNLVDELRRQGLTPVGAVDFASPIEPFFRDADGEFVDVAGRSINSAPAPTVIDISKRGFTIADLVLLFGAALIVFTLLN